MNDIDREGITALIFIWLTVFIFLIIMYMISPGKEIQMLLIQMVVATVSILAAVGIMKAFSSVINR